MQSFPEYLEEVTSLSKGAIEEKVCLWVATDLLKAKSITGLDVYSGKDYTRKARPFLSIHCYGDTFGVLFLTTSHKGHQKSVDLTLCEKEGCEDFPFFEKVYLFKHRSGKYITLPLNRFQLEELGKLCGCCKDLEKFKKFCSKMGGEK